MNELIKTIVNAAGKRAVSARELHRFLEISNDFTTWCKRMFEYGFVEGVDYSFPKMGEPDNQRVTNPKPKIDYALTIECAKEISMLQRTEKGKQARLYFIEMEKIALTTVKVKSRLELARENVELLEEIEAKDHLLEIAKPKVEFFDAVTNSDDTIDIGQAAKVINAGIGRNKLFKILREKHVLMSDNIPYQRYINDGWFRTIEQLYYRANEETPSINIKTLVYQKGLSGIIKIVRDN